MTITTDNMKKIVSDLTSMGYKVGLRDISFVLLCRVMEEKVYAYKAVFSSVPDAEPYDKYSISNKIEDLTLYMDRNYPDKEEDKHEVEDVEEDKKKEDSDDNLTFDEIKKGLEEDLASLVALRDQVDDDGNPVLPAKDLATVVGRISDIRQKLVTHFNTTEESVEQRVVVMTKYNSICEYCGHEICVDPSLKKLF